MKVRLWKIIVASLVVVAAISCAALFLPVSHDIGAKCEANNMLSLVKPAFVSVAGEGTNFLEEEAGISAYTNVGQAIDLDKAKTGFKTIEYQTSEYIIGSVAIPDLLETEDVHCYVHKDGWVLSYYLKEEPTAKIVDWNGLASTKLDKGIGEVCDAAGVPFIEATYYDFRYPNAEKLLIITDGDSFNLKIPSSFAVYERSYSFYTTYGAQNRLYIDGIDIAGVNNCGVVYGTLTPTQLLPGVSHTIELKHAVGHYEDDSDAIALTYAEG